MSAFKMLAEIVIQQAGISYRLYCYKCADIFFLLFYIEIDARALKVSSIKPKSDDMHLIVHYFFISQTHINCSICMKVVCYWYFSEIDSCVAIFFSMNHFRTCQVALKCYHHIVQRIHLKTKNEGLNKKKLM